MYIRKLRFHSSSTTSYPRRSFSASHLVGRGFVKGKDTTVQYRRCRREKRQCEFVSRNKNTWAQSGCWFLRRVFAAIDFRSQGYFSYWHTKRPSTKSIFGE